MEAISAEPGRATGSKVPMYYLSLFREEMSEVCSWLSRNQGLAPAHLRVLLKGPNLLHNKSAEVISSITLLGWEATGVTPSW